MSDLLPEPPEPADAGVLLQVTGLRKAYEGRVVLAGVDLTVRRHEVVCLIGASGSGKSTLLRCIDLLERVDDGEIEFDGRDIADPRLSADEVRKGIGLVFQAYNLFPHLSVLANCTLAARKVHRTPREAAERRARELLARFGLGDRADDYPDRLSGGQQQRVAVVRALVTRPSLLLLDEVTSALDPELVAEVLDLLRELAADGMTMVLATHEMAFARGVADQVCFLDGGVVVESGPPEQVLDDPREDRTRRFLRRVSA